VGRRVCSKQLDFVELKRDGYLATAGGRVYLGYRDFEVTSFVAYRVLLLPAFSLSNFVPKRGHFRGERLVGKLSNKVR
jgi:hypothetical protein